MFQVATIVCHEKYALGISVDDKSLRDFNTLGPLGIILAQLETKHAFISEKMLLKHVEYSLINKLVHFVINALCIMVPLYIQVL